MQVTYTFREDSYDIFPPFIYTYSTLTDSKHSFRIRSFIALYDYVNTTCSPKLHITPTQFILYDTNGKIIDDQDLMTESVSVRIESPIQTIKYYSDDYLEYIKKDLKTSDFLPLFYWITVPPSDHPDLFIIQEYKKDDLVFNGISRTNGVLKEHYVILRDFVTYKQYYMTTDCRKRYEFLISMQKK
uniref:Uncharacterized protein n=1 Tax=viral metagenome TaxID=1070528 RepID=A0A6C0KVR3_9ZZZZ